ncbi:DUF3040 domain-containing protein [Saccharopolyspora rhizosphaerae]|uniref:DUF3040 domain-containing protein n=1 Tax=Saccharopolyspora rhizosphaerae TaxID=2492662 RepID=A0A3R8QAP9_9PSEU|nr:DUF3040 domain-containing protein [Saccharopolyspora rhizosphaerae]RRO20711.1 DUF3040 domain-containing protein [Saccharopolyspora rhizosphaerae]
MLQPHERRILGEMERQLRTEDPGLAGEMAKPRSRFRTWLNTRRALGLASASLAVLCLVLGEAAAFVTTALVATALLMLNGWTFRSR